MATPPVPPVPNPNPQMTPTPMSQPTPQPGGPGPGAPLPSAAPANLQRQATVDERPGEEVAPVERSIWQAPFVQDVLPFVTSLILHIGLIALGLITAKTVEKIIYATREPVIIPDATIIEGAEVGGIPHPGLGGDDTRDAAQDQFKDVPPETGIAEKPSSSLTMALAGGGEGDNDNLIAVGPTAGKFGSGSGTGAGMGSGIGAGTGEGGALAPFGIPGGGGGIGPKSPFMGVSGNAMKVAYVCDSSGSMMSLFDTLRVELRKAVDKLQPIQGFDIIFFSEDGFLALDKQLLLATPESKRRAFEFLDKTAPHGSSNPLPGIRLAFQTQPQLIYMLTDGDFPNNDEIIQEIRKLNASKKVKINTIAFGEDTEQNFHKFLKQIADENGGLFRHVREADLRQQQ